MVDFVILLSMLPFDNAPPHKVLARTTKEERLTNLLDEFDANLGDEFSWLVARY